MNPRDTNITAKVLYRAVNGRHRFENLLGREYESVNPVDWGLDENCEVILVLVGAEYRNAYLVGEEIIHARSV